MHNMRFVNRYASNTVRTLQPCSCCCCRFVAGGGSYVFCDNIVIYLRHWVYKVIDSWSHTMFSTQFDATRFIVVHVRYDCLYIRVNT